MSHAPELLASVLQIIWINVLLSGDNAVVIALACRSFDTRNRRLAIALGCAAAVTLRILGTTFIVTLFGLPFVRVVGGILLIWIAVRLTAGGDDTEVEAAPSLWVAVKTIAIADAVMSLDNVFAVAAAAHGSMPLIIFGTAISLPLIVFGSSLILRALKRFPMLIVAGAVLLGWVAGEMIASEPQLEAYLSQAAGWSETWMAAAGAIFVATLTFGRRLLAAQQRRAGVAAMEQSAVA